MSTSRPPTPSASVVLETIHLADAYLAARVARYGTGLRVVDPSGVGSIERLPEWNVLFRYLKSLSDECLAGLYALYRLGEGVSGSARDHVERYSSVYLNAIRPCHREHAAYDLAAKGPLAHGLRRGLERLGLGAGPGGGEESGRVLPTHFERFVR
jgi:hypothetical protein